MTVNVDALIRIATEVVGDVLDNQCSDRCGASNEVDNSEAESSYPGSRAKSKYTSQENQKLDDGSNIPLSDLTGNKKSLFIGINYYGSRAELRGCINDVVNIKKFVVSNFGFPADHDHMRTLTDDDSQNMPTYANIIHAMKWLVDGVQSGDSLFLHYSGHGGSVKDLDGDEEDGMDETLIPVDYETAGQILDDDLHALLVAGLPQGVRLTAIMDCCHSGSVLDLPFTYAPDGNLEIIEKDNRKAVIEGALKVGVSLLQGNKQEALRNGIQTASELVQWKLGKNGGGNKQAREKQIALRSALADVIQFSGCRDSQTSADGTFGIQD